MGNAVTRIASLNDTIKLQEYLDTHPEIDENDCRKLTEYCFRNELEEALKTVLEYGFHKGYDICSFIFYEKIQFKSIRVVLSFMSEKKLSADKVKMTALFENIRFYLKHDEPDIVRLLIVNGAEPTHGMLNSLLTYTSCWGLPKIARVLLEHGADPNYHNGYPLYVAFGNLNLDTVILLLDYGAKIYKENLKQFLESFVSPKQNSKFIKSCIENGLNVIEWGDEFLSHACNYSCFEKVRLLLEYGANPNALSNITYSSENKITILEQLARRWGDDGNVIELSTYLIEYGADYTSLPENLKTDRMIYAYVRATNHRRLGIIPRISMEQEVFAKRCFG